MVSVDLADEAKEIIFQNTANRPNKYAPSASKRQHNDTH